MTTITAFISYLADLATERERQLTTARANQTTGLANGTAANWAPEVEFSPYRPLSRRQMTFPSLLLNQPITCTARVYLFH